MGFKNILLIAGSLVIFVSCSKNSSEPEPEKTAERPSAAKLIFPENNTECNEGEIISYTKSNVVFRWDAYEQTDTYEVHLKNLESKSVSKVDADTNEAKITIERGTAYEWYVISMSTKSEETTNSETWKFYNAGEGSISHAPFPADAISPKNSSEISPISGKIDLEWNTSDIDDDIVGYNVFFGTDNTLAESLATTMEKKISVDVTSGTTYFWLVETEDSSNNVSRSDVFNFKVK